MSEEQSVLGSETTEQQATAQPTSTEASIELPEKFGGDVSKLVESYNHLESKMGRMFSLPSEDSSSDHWNDFTNKVVGTGKFIQRPDPENPEQLNNFYNQLGRPETPDKYDVGVPEALSNFVDGDTLQQYKELAHKAGLNNDQAKALMAFETQRLERNRVDQMEKKQQGEAALRQAWGPDFDNRLEGAKAAIRSYQEKYPDAVKELLEGPSGNNPALISMLSELGQVLQESGAVGASNMPQYGMSADDARAKIQEVFSNPAHPYHNSNDRGHAEAQAQMERYYKIAHPGDNR